MLKSRNYEVFSISNPSKSIQTIQNTLPDLIILDWLMPQKEGIDVLKEIKQQPELNEIPVIISSGIRTHSENLHEALEYGAIDFLKKPIDEIELEARVKSAIKMYDYLKETRILQEENHEIAIRIAEAKSELYQSQLNKKNREMLVSAVSIFQNKKLINVIKTDIFKEVELNEIHKFQVSKVLDRYENISNSINWDLFEKSFTEINDNFYNKLLTDFPHLSNSELRLCAFFKLGLTTKEIATINYSSYEAIRKAIYRIRKKINIKEKTDLNLFFQGY